MTRTASWWRQPAQQSRWRGKASAVGIVAAGAMLVGCALGADLIAYDLPPEEDRYTLSVDIEGTETVWQFDSGHADVTDALPEQYCLGPMLVFPDDNECRVEPLIFLRYDLSLELDNSTRANQPHEITVEGYYQEALTERPTVNQAQVEASYDGGQTWTELATQADGDGVFTVNAQHPGSAAGQAVWLRVTASDDEGNSVVQTKPEVFTLS